MHAIKCYNTENITLQYLKLKELLLNLDLFCKNDIS